MTRSTAQLSARAPCASSVELVNVTKHYPGQASAVVQNVSLSIQAGEFFSLLGPSGCGKTTTLRIIAGFETFSAGELRIGGQSCHGIPAHRRDVNLVFQNYALFPHLTVAENVAFGLRLQKLGKAQVQARVAEVLDLVRLTGLESRSPRQLSGGQQQRVAIARALAPHPAVLLLDEPLGALDLKLRQEMQVELKKLQRKLGMTFIYVTHDQEEALAMSDRLAVMHGGQVLQVGTPQDIYESPSCRFVADFIGESNFFEGHVLGEHSTSGVAKAGGHSLVRVPALAAPLHLPATLPAGSQVTLAIRPERVRLQPALACDTELSEGMPANTPPLLYEGRILEAVYGGKETRYRVQLGHELSVLARLTCGTQYHVGEKVHVSWQAENLRVLAPTLATSCAP